MARLGMYRGNSVLPPARELYYDRFKFFSERVLYRGLLQKLVDYGTGVSYPPGKVKDYLRAYLLISSEISRLEEDPSYREFLKQHFLAILDETYPAEDYYDPRFWEVVPGDEETAVRAGPWVDVSAPWGPEGATSGLTILTHPDTPGFPPPWILRRQGSMRNPVFPGAKPVPLSVEEPLVLRYRLVVHRGGARSEEIQAWQAEYAGQ